MCEINNLRKLLNSENTDQLTTGLYTLLHNPNKADFLDELYICANNPNAKVRLPAIMVLSEIGKKEIIPILERSLTDEIEKIRMITAISLADFKNKKAIPILINMIENDIDDHSLHKRAIEALGKFKDESLINIFKQLLKHRRKISKIKALEALKKIETENAYRVLENALLAEKDYTFKLSIKNALRNFEYS